MHRTASSTRTPTGSIGTPPEIIARLRKEVSAVLAEPEVKQFLIGIGAAPVTDSPMTFDTMLKADYLSN